MSIQLDEIAGLLPILQPAENVILDTGGAFIHAPGFEDRTMAFLDVIKPNRESFAVLLDYRPFNQRNRMDDVRKELADVGIQCKNQHVLTYHRFEPEDFEQSMNDLIRYLGVTHVVVDISTMSKLAIILTLRVLGKMDVSVSILYSEAKDYGPNEAEFDRAKECNEVHRPSLQVFTGVHGVVRIDSLASVAMQGQPTAALAFMSFNDALTQTLLNTVYPARLFLINGRPPEHFWRENATAWIHDHVRIEWSDDNPLQDNDDLLPARSVSTLDYRETVILLLDLYWQLSPNHRILLAPAGSKLQAVGCYIMKALHPDVHIEYPSPEGFLNVYSSGVGKRWVLNMGNIKALIEGIQMIERHIYLQI